MEDPVVGGYTPEKVALRRAINLAVDVDKEIRLVRKSQAIPAQSPVAPGTWGYDPAFKSEMSDFDRAKAKALLDLYGYVDRDGDGWREQPDGAPLVLEYATQPDQASRNLVELWKKNMDAIGIRIVFKPAKWPENLKASSAGKLMMWGVGWTAGTPDAERLSRPRLRPEQGPGQQGALRPAGLQQGATNAEGAARRPRAAGGDRRGQEARRRLHAVQDPRAPHLHRPHAALGRRLPAQHLREPRPGVALRRHRPRLRSAGPRRETACLRGLLGAGAACAGARPWLRPAPAHGAAGRAEGAALRLPAPPRPASTRRRSSTSTRAPSRRTSSRACTATTTWRGRSRSCRDGGGDARGVGRLPHLDGAHQARHLLRRRPGLQRQAARAGGAGLRLRRSSASSTRRSRARRCPTCEDQGIVGLDALRDEALKSKQAVRLRPPSRRPARARPLHARSSASRGRGRASSYFLAGGDLLGAVAREVVEPTATRSPRTRWAPGRSC